MRLMNENTRFLSVDGADIKLESANLCPKVAIFASLIGKTGKLPGAFSFSLNPFEYFRSFFRL